MGLKIRQSSSRRGGPLVSVSVRLQLTSSQTTSGQPFYCRDTSRLTKSCKASLSPQPGWATVTNTPTHTHPQLTHLLPNRLISVWDKLRKWRRGKGSREMEETELRTPVKDFNLFMGQSDWPAPSSQMSEICLRAAP